MELIQGFINQPQDQSAEEAIPILCERLLHSTLITDRRAAVLGLKSFSRQFRESVIADGLKALVSTLQRDFMEETIVRAVLETILILFIRGEGDEDLTRNWISHQSRKQNGKYPSPSLLIADLEADHFSLWIADELTRTDDTLHILVSVLDSTSDQEFYTKLYALQILQAVLSTRPERTKECILASPLGVSTILNMVSDTHEAVRNEAILLLMGLVNDNYHIQKVVAFEGIFDKMFDTIDQEGGIEGNIVVQDCLSLITNLLKYNPSNQSLFLETGCIPRLGGLLGQPLISSELGSIIWNGQRLSNLITTLEIVRLFVVEGQPLETLEKNQAMLGEMLMLVLRLVFSNLTPNNIKAVALLTTADLIRDNRSLQEQLSQVDVPLLDPTVPNSLSKPQVIVPVTSALLNWCLLANSVHTFPLRACASKCLHSLFSGNSQAKISFMENQALCFQQGETNIFETLIIYDADIRLNPYKVWFAAVILLYLFEDCPETKVIAREVTTGDAEAGEEVLGSIPAISELLASSSFDRRVSMGYLMALIVWIYEDFDAVDDFLHDASTVKSLLTTASLNHDVLVQGMTSLVLGIAYEFSRSDSPIPRKELHSLILKILGKDNYFQNLLKLQDSGCLTEIDESMLLEPAKDESGLPQLFLCNSFVALIRENFSRLLRCLSHDPETEPILRLSYEVYDGLLEKYSLVSQDLTNIQREFEDLKIISANHIEQLQIAQTDATEKLQSLNLEIESLKESNSNYASSNHSISAALTQAEISISALEDKHQKVLLELEKARKDCGFFQQENQRLETSLKNSQEGKTLAENGINKMNRELFKLSKEKDTLESNLKTIESECSKKEKTFERKKAQLEQSVKEKEAKVASLTDRVDSITMEFKERLSRQNQLENQTHELQGQAQKYQSLSDNYLARLKEAKDVLDDLNTEKKRREETEAKVKNDIERSISEIEKHILDVRNGLSSTENRKIELEEYSQLLKMSTLKLAAEFSTLKSEHDELTKSNAALKDNFSSVEISRSGMEKQLEELSEARDLLESQLSHSAKESASHDSKICQLKDEIVKLKSEKEDLNEGLKRELKKLDQDHLQQVQESEQRIKELEETVLSLQAVVTEHEDVKVRLDARVAELEVNEQQKNILDDKLQLLEHDKTNIEHDLLACQKERDSQKQDYEDRLHEMTEVSGTGSIKVADLQREVDTLQQRLDKVVVEKAGAEKSLQRQIDDSAKRSTDELQRVTDLKNQLEQDKGLSEQALAKAQQELKEAQTSLSSKETDLTRHIHDAQRSSSSFQQEKELFKNKIAKMTTHIDTLERDLDLKGKEIEREREMLTGNSEAVIQDYSVRISKLNEDMTRIEKESYKKVSKLENVKDQLSLEARERQSELESCNTELNSVTKALKAAEEELAKNKDGQQKLIDALKEKVRESSAKVEAHQRSLDTSEQKKGELEKQVALLADELSTTASELKGIKAMYDDGEKKAEMTMSELRAFRSEKDDLQKELQEKASALKYAETYLDDAKSSNNDQHQQLSNLLTEMDQLQKSQQNSESEFQTKLTSSSAKQQEADAEKVKISQELDETRKALETTVASLKKDLQSEVEARDAAEEKAKFYKSSLETLEARQQNDASRIAELEESKQELVPRTDLDDLMLIMSELEEKNEKYKKMLKEAGQDVSSDEDSSDDEEG